MLNSSSISDSSLFSTNVGLAAYQVAAVQAKVFVKTLSDVTTRQEQVVDEQARKSEAQRQKVRQQIAEARGGVDFVVERSQNVPDQNPAPVSNPNAQSNKVDFQV